MSPIYVPGKVTLAKEFTWNETVWNPSMISTALWLDSADASTVTLNSSNVSQWNDKSGNGKHVSATGAAQPLYVSAAQNSNNIIRFNGVNDVLQRTAPLITGAAARSTFIVAKDLNAGVVFDYGTDTAMGRYSTRLNPAFIGFNTSNIQWSTIGDAQYGVYAFIQAGSTTNSINGFWNGTQYSFTDSVQPTSVINTASGVITVGCQVDLSGFGQADVAEIVVVSGAVSLSVRQKIEGYLAHKWGLTAKLPSDHPYKLVGPTP